MKEVYHKLNAKVNRSKSIQIHVDKLFWSKVNILKDFKNATLDSKKTKYFNEC